MVALRYGSTNPMKGNRIRKGAVVINRVDGRKGKVIDYLYDKISNRTSYKVMIAGSTHTEWWTCRDIVMM